jgi:integrase
METQAKPRVSLAEYEAMMKNRTPTYAPFSVADILERYIREMNGTATVPGLKPLLSGHLYGLRMLQRMPIAQKDARTLTIADWKEHCNMRIKTVCAATVNQDLTYFRSPLDYAPSAWPADCSKVSAKSIEDAIPVLKKYNLIGKGRPRSRRPADEERDMLEAYFDAHPSSMPMRKIMEFATWSARRRGEICRLRFEDVSEEKRTCIVRDMKDPKFKKGNDHEFPLLGRAWDLVEPRLKAWKEAGRPSGASIWPYNAVSVGAYFTRAKKELGIKNLRFHDLRRDAASRLFEAGYSVQEVMLVTGHKTPVMLLRVYTALKAEDLHKGPAAKRGMEGTNFVVPQYQSYGLLEQAKVEHAEVVLRNRPPEPPLDESWSRL